jgi:hypothetical protein
MISCDGVKSIKMLERLLLCTDLDRTLIPNGTLPESPQARLQFLQFVSQPWVTLAYVTGRDLALVEEAIAVHQLPLPNFVIADVGSSLYELQGGRWLRLSDWDDTLEADWRSLNSSDLRVLLTEPMADYPDCYLQEPQKQGRYKLSYYFSLTLPRVQLITMIADHLDRCRIEANLICSIDERAQIGLLDILPRSANKLLAITYLMNQENFCLENTLFSGDSGNDLDVLISPIKSVLVANADPTFKTQVVAEVAKLGLANSLYLAQGDRQLNGNYSAGILEGINYYFPHIQI